MRVLQIFILFTSFIILTSFESSSLTVEAKLLRKFKVDLIEEDGYMEFLKFKMLYSDRIFLISPSFDIKPRKSYKKYRVYKITYGPGGLWYDAKSKCENELEANEDLEKYPVHFMLEIERVK